ncbi:YqzH family protein [Gottfriedia acidiceleris]|uniref:YqzH family protein n=1 Tax=Gottfriedia acidiceleris TaxID=371036 RepID=UPI000B432B0D|nr:YqzH family protein [Gottfriedia acidiceleris]
MNGQFIKQMIKRALMQYRGEHEQWITADMLNQLYDQIVTEQLNDDRELHELVQDIVYEYVTNYA